MAILKLNLGFLGLVDWELCLLEVGQFCGQLLAILITVQWCQVAQRNTRYIPSRYTHHILPHIGHWWPFGNNCWSTISSHSFRSFLGVDLTHLIKPSVHLLGCWEKVFFAACVRPSIGLKLCWRTKFQSYCCAPVCARTPKGNQMVLTLDRTCVWCSLELTFSRGKANVAVLCYGPVECGHRPWWQSQMQRESLQVRFSMKSYLL